MQSKEDVAEVVEVVKNNCSDCLIIICLLIILILGLKCLYKYLYPSFCLKHGHISGFGNVDNQVDMKKYSPLYTNKYKYTNPVGDKDFLQSTGHAIGTRGGFLPLQGRGAGYFLALTDENNQIDVDLVGGDPNILGFNDFGMSEENKGLMTDSYLVQGNKRVATPGKSNKLIDISGKEVDKELDCLGGLPHYIKHQGSCVLPTDHENLQKVFEYKNTPAWKKI